MTKSPIRCLLAAAAVLTAAAFVPSVMAARDMEQPAKPTGGFEIVVMEVKGCRYCPLFRSDVLPVYMATPRARDVPVRFQDLNAEGADSLQLRGPIDMVPTAVLVQGKTEIGRITGYVGPTQFPRMVTDLMLGRQ